MLSSGSLLVISPGRIGSYSRARTCPARACTVLATSAASRSASRIPARQTFETDGLAERGPVSLNGGFGREGSWQPEPSFSQDGSVDLQLALSKDMAQAVVSPSTTCWDVPRAGAGPREGKTGAGGERG